MKFMRTVARIFDRIVDAMAYTAGILSITVMVFICYLVMMRYIFGMPPAWVLEVCEYLLIYITFLSATWLLRQNGHVRVDLFLSWISPSWQLVIRIFTSCMSGLACAVLFFCGAMVTLDNYTRHILSIQTLSVPKWILYAVIPLGALALAFEFFRQAFQVLQDLQEQRLPAFEQKSATSQGA